jgi:LPS-assembly protein
MILQNTFHRRGGLPLVCICLSLLLLAAPKPGFPAATGLDAEFGGKSVVKAGQGKWKISATKITYDEKRKVYDASGNVVISSVGRLMQADWAELDTENQRVELQGNVFLQYGQDWIWGESVFWNLQSQTGWVNGGIAYFAQNHFYVHGDYIAKTGEKEYELRNGFVTSCDPAHPAWDIRYKSMDITVGGTAWVRDTSLWVKNLFPVFYTPIAAMPVKRERQSGFLVPWAGNSNLNGFEAEVPFYWAIRQDMDATFYGRYMADRGFMGGVEYRIDNTTWGKGIWLFNYLQDEADRNHLASLGYPFQTEERYWLRARHVFDLPQDIKGFLDLDYASDRNLLNEFTTGSISYPFSNNLFQQFMGRGILDDQTILVRESSLYLERPRESSLLSMDIRYWEQLADTPQSITLERLPALGFNVTPSWINHTPLYYTIGSSYVNYYRETGDRGERLNFEPKIYYPMHWKNYLDFQPSFGLLSSGYLVDWQGDSKDPWQGRLYSDASLSLSSRLNRVYPLHFGNLVGVQHAIRPEVVYEYVPQLAQGNIPHFDRLDVSPAQHDVRYGFTSFLTTKEIIKTPDGRSTTSYREMARLQIFQAFNIESTQQVFFDQRFNTQAQKGFSDVNVRMDLMPKRFITLSYVTDIAPDEGEANRQTAYVTLDSGKGQSLNLSYQYRKDTNLDEIIPQVNLKILPNVTVSSYVDYALNSKELFSQGYGVTYQHGCWGFTAGYQRDNLQDQFIFTINLLGLGSIGYNIGPTGGSPVISGTRGGQPLSIW